MCSAVTLSITLLALLLPGINTFDYNVDDYVEFSTDDPEDICQVCHPYAVCSPEKTCMCKEGFVGDGHLKCDDVDECLVDSGVCGVGGNCSNNPGSFSCTCQHGYRPTTGRPESFNPLLNATQCVDVDECQENPKICADGGQCVNSAGSFSCSCLTGYRSNIRSSGQFHTTKDTFPCIDIDECREDPRMCGVGGNCLNNPGSFSCTCQTGYRFPTGLSESFNPLLNESICIDVDECLMDPGVCGAGGNCSNNHGSFSCTCQNGYRPTTVQSGSFHPLLNATHCLDVDECQENPKICADGGQCVNSPGSFSCSCLTGYRSNIRSSGQFHTTKDTFPCIDIDECREDPRMCGVGGNCLNNPGSFSCTCQTGYRFPTGLSESFNPLLNGSICIDVDECLMDPGVCGTGGNCSNNHGSFSCTCQNGYRPTTGQSGSFHPLLNATHCLDVDECQENPKICADGGQCVNSPGSFSCSCLTGYRSNIRSSGQFHTTKDTFPCIDIDECREDPRMCGVGGNCLNNPGSFSCTCQTGYRLPIELSESFNPLLNGSICIDVDECLMDPGVCGTGGNCSNNHGSFSCTCQNGYRPTTGQSGSFHPLLNATHCLDVDECQENPKICADGGQCVNSPGSFSCSCLTGYRSNIRSSGQFHTTKDTFPCIDIDECREDPRMCGVGGNCLNNPGSFSCTCQTGYRLPIELSESFNPLLNGSICIDVDECLVDPGVCGAGGNCSNNHGSFSCTCQNGYRPTTGQSGSFHPLLNATHCLDVDECQENPKICADGGQCVNSPGSFSCSCLTGYRSNIRSSGQFPTTKDTFPCIDIDECREDPRMCGVGGNCLNNPGSFSCTCQTGYRLPIELSESFNPLLNGSICIDVDECLMDPGVCGAGGNCSNHPGSFSCTCQNGYRPTTGQSGSFHPLLNATHCVDVDECQENPKICADGGQCVNSPGSFSCSCLNGYRSNIRNSGQFHTRKDTFPCIAAPVSLRALHLEKNSELTWEVEGGIHDEVYRFQVSLRGERPYNPSFVDNREIVMMSSNQSVHVPLSLLPGTQYTIDVSVTNASASNTTQRLVRVVPIAAPPTPNVVFDFLGSMSLPLRLVPDNNGPVSSYQVIVAPLEDCLEFPCANPTLGNFWRALGSGAYIIAELQANNTWDGMPFQIGDRKSYGGYYNGISRYGDHCVVLRVVSSWNNDTKYSCSPYAVLKRYNFDILFILLCIPIALFVGGLSMILGYYTAIKMYKSQKKQEEEVEMELASLM
uniref:fibrillin-2-like n=1 Tax=Myxine glutinosa TaxID=7769 RepID=UPI00358E08AB